MDTVVPPLTLATAARARAMLLAEQASKEMNPVRLQALIEQLCRELDAANGRGRA